MRATGVYFHSASRPVTAGKSATSVECEALGAGLDGDGRCACASERGRVLRRSGIWAVGVLREVMRHPTEPSMPISMSLLSSSAYSMGSSRAIGSMKPRTIIAMASSSGMPRDIR